MQIKYSDGITTVIMPQTRPYEPSGEIEGNMVRLANGDDVMEAVGFRTVFTAEWDWVPQSDIVKLLAMLRKNPFVNVTYYDPVDGEKTGVFRVLYPTVSVWRYRQGIPYWHDVKITHRGQGLT